MTHTQSQDTIICNARGLHARASVALSKEALKFKSKVTVSHEGQSADAASVMDLLMLAASKGSTVNVHVDGEDASEALQTLIALIENKFGEAE
jgi:phosphocarrier protein